MKTKKSAASSRPEKLTRMSEADIRKYAKSPAAKAAAEHFKSHEAKHGPGPTDKDLQEIPLFDGVDPALFRPVKTPVTVRLDGDIVMWLKKKPGRYQTNLNAELRKAMQREKRSTREPPPHN